MSSEKVYENEEVYEHKDVYENIGEMPMPVNFRYAEVFRQGRPRHGKPGKLSTYDLFYIKHPPMDTVRRAKLFSAFDALKGFGDRIASKEVLYEDRRELTEEEKKELDRRLAVIRRLTASGRLARQNKVEVKVTRFVPCTDPESEACGAGRGQYETVSGIVRRVDEYRRAILVGDERISLDSVTGITGNPILEQDE